MMNAGISEGYGDLTATLGMEVGNAEALSGLLQDVERQLALTRLVDADDAEAKKTIMANSLRLVANIARRYSDHGVELVDLMKDGIQGLIHAIKKFEREGGFRFLIYARFCIRKSIEQAIQNRKGAPVLAGC